MFKNVISLTPPYTREMKQNSCVSFTELNGDNTLFMTAAAVLHNRVESLKMTSYIVHGAPYSDDNMRNPKYFSFCWYIWDGKAEDFIEVIKDDHKEIIALTNVEKFVESKTGHKIEIRIMPNENLVCFFTKQITQELYHFLQSFISLYFPVFKEKPLSESETEFLRSLTMKVSTNYLRCLADLTNYESFRKYALEQQLNGFEKRIFDMKITAALDKLNSYDREMNRLLEQYREACNKRNDAAIVVEGLNAMSEKTEEKTELQDYLVNNKNLTNIAISGSNITFIVKAFLAPYHFDDWDNFMSSGSIYRGYNTYEWDDPANVKLLLDAIFSENHTLKLKMCSYFSLDYQGGGVSTQRNYNFTGVNPGLKDYIPNPHLNRHECFGQNRTDVLEQLRCGDAVGAIECCINLAKKVNVNEVSQTFRPFINDLLKFSGKCIVTPDGQELSPCEALKYLKGQENENNSVDE